MFDGSTLVSDIRFYLTREVSGTGIYEPTLTRLFQAFVKPGDIVFDVGANVGYFTMLSANLTGRDGRVFAFEPIPANADLVEESRRANDYRNTEIVKAFCGDNHNDSASMTIPTPDNLGTGSFVDLYKDRAHCTVRTLTLDQFCADRDLDRVDFLKMDIEGGEAVAILGMLKGLASHRFKLIAVEFHAKHLRHIGADAMALKRLFISNGYRPFEICPPDELVDRTDTLDGSFMVFAAPDTLLHSQRKLHLAPIRQITSPSRTS